MIPFFSLKQNLSCSLAIFIASGEFVVENDAQAFHTTNMNFWGGSDDKLFQEYSRPVYYSYHEMDDGSYNPATVMLVYSGNRWFGSIFPDKYVENMTLEENLVLWSDYHGECPWATLAKKKSA